MSAGQDDDALDDTAVLRHGAQGGDYSGVQGPAVTVTVADDDTAGMQVSRTALEIGEGDSDTYTVMLTSEPTAAVTVTVVIPPGTDISVGDRSLEFTRDNWDEAQTVTVSAGQDDDAVDDTVVLRHGAQGGDYSGLQGPAVTVTVQDDDTAGVMVSRTALIIPEGESGSYTVVLTSKPTAAVTVTVGGHTESDLTLSKTSLTFTAADWAEARTVTVSAGQDDDAVDDTAVLRHDAQGGGYTGVQGLAVTVTVRDDDTAEVVVSRTALAIPEGESGSYTVVLTSEPTAVVTVTVSGHAGSDLMLSEASLTFTAVDWGDAQTVTVMAGQDNDAADDTVTLVHAVSGYGTVTMAASVTVIVTDDDELISLSASFSPTELSIEEGETARVTLRITASRAPAGLIRYRAFTSDGTAEAVDDYEPVLPRIHEADRGDFVEQIDGRYVYEQVFELRSVEEREREDDETFFFSVTPPVDVEETDYSTEVVGGENAVQVTILDDDTPGVLVDPVSLMLAEGETDTYTVVLTGDPTGPVTVSVSEHEGTMTVSAFRHTGTDLSVSSSALTFTSTDWRMAQTVTVMARWDDDALDDTVILQHSALGGGYNGVWGSDVMVRIFDGDTAGVVVSRTALAIPEGESGRYTVMLTSEPTAAVTVTVSGHAGSDLMLSEASLTFTAADWGEAQTVTVSVGEDEDAANDVVTLQHEAQGGDYTGVQSPAVTVTVRDDEIAGVVVSKALLEINEGERDTYTVMLMSEPTDTVTVTVTVDGTVGTDLTLSTLSLTFTALDWNVAQTVTVTAGQDTDIVHDIAVLRHDVMGGDYDGMRGPDVEVMVTDDDRAVVKVSQTLLEIDEGESDTYTVVLASEPTRAVTVTVRGTEGTDLSVSAVELTFTMSDWDVAQTVAVTARQDADALDDFAVLRHNALGAGYDGVRSADVMIRISDDDTAGVVVSRTSLEIAEGEKGAYTVVLTSEPADTVTVTVGGTANTDLTLSTPSLTFTASDWDVKQTVTVSASQDDDAINDVVTLMHSVSGGDYDGVIADDVVVTVADDERGVIITPTSLEVEEGSTGAYMVVLASEPTGLVTVTVDGMEGTDVSVDNTSLEFAPSNWSAAQTVEVTAAEDTDSEDDLVVLAHGVLSGGYAGVIVTSVTVTVSDNDPDLAERLDQLNLELLPEVTRTLLAMHLEGLKQRIEDAIANMGADADAETRQYRLGGTSSITDLLRMAGRSLSEKAINAKQKLKESSFVLPLNRVGGSRKEAALWGSGNYRKLSSDSGQPLDWDGDFASGSVGMDQEVTESLLAGVVVSHAKVGIDYSRAVDQGVIKGDYELRLTGISPYMAWGLENGVNAWGMAAYNWGDLEIREGTAENREKGKLKQWSVAAGVSGPVYQSKTTKVRLEVEGSHARTQLEGSGEMRSQSVNVGRVRLLVKGKWEHSLDGEDVLIPSVELGLRQDWGDGSTEAGLELGAGISYEDRSRGLLLEGRGRWLLASGSPYDEWGISGSMSVKPRVTGRGLSLDMSSSWGIAEGGANRLWQHGLPQSGGISLDAASWSIKGDLGYGFAGPGDQSVLTPYMGFSWSGARRRDYWAGLRLEFRQGLKLNMEGRYNAVSSEQSVRIQVIFPW